MNDYAKRAKNGNKTKKSPKKAASERKLSFGAWFQTAQRRNSQLYAHQKAEILNYFRELGLTDRETQSDFNKAFGTF